MTTPTTTPDPTTTPLRQRLLALTAQTANAVAAAYQTLVPMPLDLAPEAALSAFATFAALRTARANVTATALADVSTARTVATALSTPVAPLGLRRPPDDVERLRAAYRTALDRVREHKTWQEEPTPPTPDTASAPEAPAPPDLPIVEQAPDLTGRRLDVSDESHRSGEDISRVAPDRLAAPPIDETETARLAAAQATADAAEAERQAQRRALEDAVVRRIARSEPAEAARLSQALSMLQQPVSGWRRVVGPHPCALCRTLASDGTVFPVTTHITSPHPGCHCTAEPIPEETP